MCVCVCVCVQCMVYRCVKYFKEWISSLKGDGEGGSGEGEEEGEREEGEEEEEGVRRGGCNLLEALKLALELPDLDTICVLLSTT